MTVLLASEFAHPDDNKAASLSPVLDVHQLSRIPEALDPVNPCAPTADVPSIGSLFEWISFAIGAKHFDQETYLASHFSSLTDRKLSRGGLERMYQTRYYRLKDVVFGSANDVSSDLSNDHLPMLT